MRVTQHVLHSARDTVAFAFAPQPNMSSVLLAFGSPTLFAANLPRLRDSLPNSLIAGCSTAGDIANDAIYDDTLVLTLLEFASTTAVMESVTVTSPDQTMVAAQQLARQLPTEQLKHVFVFSDGLHVNGSSLAAVLNRYLPLGVTVTGGLAGDGPRFQNTRVFDANGAHTQRIIALGLYGKQLHVGYGSMGGWESFGPERKITRSHGNVLYELDGQSALSLYKMYLGEAAAELPASGLLFPLHLHANDDRQGVVRTILSIDEAQQSMIFAGDMPQGATVRLMRAHFDRLIDGATGAAQLAAFSDDEAAFALLVSCVGRRLVLQQQCQQEIVAVQRVLGPHTIVTGFYSYGELCPQGQLRDCSLHNQTMTITSLRESA